MLIDKQNQFSDAQAVTTTAVSTNVIDLGVARDIGGAVTEQLMLLCEVVTAFTAGGAATMTVQFQTSPDNSSWSILAQSDAIPVASLVQGYKFLPNELPGGTSRYIRLNYVVATGPMTAGAISAALVPSLDVQPNYARGYTA
jgi:hypothetical protein